MGAAHSAVSWKWSDVDRVSLIASQNLNLVALLTDEETNVASRFRWAAPPEHNNIPLLGVWRDILPKALLMPGQRPLVVGTLQPCFPDAISSRRKSTKPSRHAPRRRGSSGGTSRSADCPVAWALPSLPGSARRGRNR